MGCLPCVYAYGYVCMCDQSCLTLCDPMDCSPPGSSVHGDSPSKNTGVGCCFLLQGIFLTQDETCVSCAFCAGRQILYRCTAWEVTFSSSPHCHLLERAVHSPPLRRGEVGSFLQGRGSIRINPSEFCCREISLSWVCVHSAIYFYLYGLMDIYFILWVIVQYSPAFFCFALSVPTFTIESSFSELLCAFNVLPCAFLSCF